MGTFLSERKKAFRGLEFHGVKSIEFVLEKEALSDWRIAVKMITKSFGGIILLIPRKTKGNVYSYGFRRQKLLQSFSALKR